MEIYKGGLKGYWKRRAYERLDGSGSRRRRRQTRAELGGGRRPFWRIKISPKLRFFRAVSPKRFFARIRDAYVQMMLGFANSGGFGGYGGDAVAGFGRPQVKEYDEKVIVEIYKSLMAQKHLIASAVNGGGEVVLRGPLKQQKN